MFQIRDCETYKEEYDECTSFRGRFQQYFIYGESIDCNQWKKDYNNCCKWTDDKDYKAGVSFYDLLFYETQQIQVKKLSVPNCICTHLRLHSDIRPFNWVSNLQNKVFAFWVHYLVSLYGARTVCVINYYFNAKLFENLLVNFWLWVSVDRFLFYLLQKTLVESETARRIERFRNHYKNDVWKKRSGPPADFSKPLPEWMVKRDEGTYLAQKAREIASGIEPEKTSSCCIM